MLNCSVFCHSIGDFVWTRSWSILLLMEGILIGLLNKLKFASFRCLAEQAQNHDRYCSAWKKEWWHNQKPYLAFSKYELDQTFTTYSLVNTFHNICAAGGGSFFFNFLLCQRESMSCVQMLTSSIHRYDGMVLARLIRTTLELPNHRYREQILAPDVLLKFVSFNCFVLFSWWQSLYFVFSCCWEWLPRPVIASFPQMCYIHHSLSAGVFISSFSR